MKRCILVAVGFALVVLGFGAAAFCEDVSTLPIAIKSYRGIPYIDSGIGLDERKALAIIGKDYNLKLVFYVTTREYLADVDLAVRDSAGNTLIDLVSEGPWFFTKLPPGMYTAEATAMGKKIRKRVRVKNNGQAEVRFVWKKTEPDEPK